jgi:hypothetical protein
MTILAEKNQGQDGKVVAVDMNNEMKDQLDNGRRSVLRKLAVGAVALAGCSVLPERWTTPLVEFGVLPAHAVTSGGKADAPFTKTEVIPKTGVISIDKTLRPKFVSAKVGWEYGSSMKIVIDTGGVIHVPNTKQDVITRDERIYRCGGRPNFPETPTMEVYCETGSKATSITIHYEAV